MASFCVEAFGTERLLSVSKSEIQKRLRMIQSLIQFDIELE